MRRLRERIKHIHSGEVYIFNSVEESIRGRTAVRYVLKGETMGTNYGFECDDPDCTYVTQNEDDHIITPAGNYLCIPCAKKRGFIEQCDEDCLTHHPTCDGFCDHLEGHINACMIKENK